MYDFKPNDIELLHELRRFLNTSIVEQKSPGGDIAQTSPAFAAYLGSLLAEAEETFWDAFEVNGKE